MAVIISPKILEKLRTKHGVSRRDVEQCFENRTGKLLDELREEHRTDPPTRWFIAPTNKCRLLKVCYVPRNGDLYIRSAFPPDSTELHIYRTKGKPSDF
jgi:uncharacterized DUF497 family protein